MDIAVSEPSSNKIKLSLSRNGKTEIQTMSIFFRIFCILFVIEISFAALRISWFPLKKSSPTLSGSQIRKSLYIKPQPLSRKIPHSARDDSKNTHCPLSLLGRLEFGHFECERSEPQRGVTYQPRATPWVRIETEIEP
jgi:hypothetical protein